MNEYIDKCVYKWMNIWMDGCMDGYESRWVEDESIYK